MKFFEGVVGGGTHFLFFGSLRGGDPFFIFSESQRGGPIFYFLGEVLGRGTHTGKSIEVSFMLSM